MSGAERPVCGLGPGDECECGRCDDLYPELHGDAVSGEIAQTNAVWWASQTAYRRARGLNPVIGKNEHGHPEIVGPSLRVGWHRDSSKADPPTRFVIMDLPPEHMHLPQVESFVDRSDIAKAQAVIAGLIAALEESAVDLDRLEESTPEPDR
jgi:hypothetical protein